MTNQAKLLFVCTVISGCGGSLLEPGEYEVSSFFVRDDLLTQAGTESTSIWRFDQIQDTVYLVTVMGGPKGAIGIESNDVLVISKEQDLSCGGQSTFYSTISLREGSSNQFKGMSNLTIDLCSLNTQQQLVVEAHLVGEKVR